MNFLPTDISNQILTIGPDYKNHRGGIGAVIETYSTFFQPFHFIPTFRPFNSKYKKAFFFIKQLYLIIKYLQHNKNIKIVHIHGSQKASFYRKFLIFLVIKKIFHKKIIYHIHSGQYDIFYKNASLFKKKWIQYFIRKADMIVCLSNYWKIFFTQHFYYKHITIVNNVIPLPIQKTNFNLYNIINILFLGRINNNKGVFDLLHVLKKNKNLYKDKIRLYIGGDGEIEKLKKYVIQNDLNDIVEYIGWVSKEEKDNVLHKTHLYVLPSYAEGLPVSILEAMSYGIPIISTNIGGVPEIVKHHHNGWLLQPGDIEELNTALQFFINQPKYIKEYGNNSLIMVKPYLPEAVIEQLTQCYQTVLNMN